jgi:hypothetical protein
MNLGASHESGDFQTFVGWRMIWSHGQTQCSSSHEKKTRKSQLGSTATACSGPPTEFEMQVKRIGLTKSEYFASAELKGWCEHNRHRVYVPQWLLEAWRMPVDPHSIGVS